MTGLKKGEEYLGGEGHASRDEQSALCYPCCHHAELALLDEVDKVFYLLFERWVLEVLLSVGVGWLVAGIRIAERHLV